MKKIIKEIKNNKIKYIVIGSAAIIITALCLMLYQGSGFTLNILSGNSTYEDSATSSNATAANMATAPNATNSNATDANATNSNAQVTDNILHLNSIHFRSQKVTVGNRVYIDKSTSGACNSAMSISFVEKSNGTTFSVEIQSINDNPYFIVPANLAVGSYKVSDIVLIGLNSDGTNFSKYYSSSRSGNEITPLDFDITLNVERNESKNINFSNLKLLSASALKGNEVGVSYNSNGKLETLKLTFKSNRGNEFSAYVNDLHSKPNFKIGNDVEVDDYYLYQATLSTKDNTTIYTNNKNYKFNINLSIKKGKTAEFVYNNENINDTTIKSIYNAPNNITVTINATTSSIISSSLFDAIKGTDKTLVINYNDHQIVFNGKDIQKSKTIDVKIDINSIETDTKLTDFISEGYVINFVDNGNLPGKALVRLKITDAMSSFFGNSKPKVYYYDEYNNGFVDIATEVQENDGYYEFSINHNSKYVLTNFKISDNLLIEDTNVVDFQGSNKFYLLMIGLGVSLIVASILVVIIIKKKKKN